MNSLTIENSFILYDSKKRITFETIMVIIAPIIHSTMEFNEKSRLCTMKNVPTAVKENLIKLNMVVVTNKLDDLEKIFT